MLDSRPHTQTRYHTCLDFQIIEYFLSVHDVLCLPQRRWGASPRSCDGGAVYSRLHSPPNPRTASHTGSPLAQSLPVLPPAAPPPRMTAPASPGRRSLTGSVTAASSMSEQTQTWNPGWISTWSESSQGRDRTRHDSDSDSSPRRAVTVCGGSLARNRIAIRIWSARAASGGLRAVTGGIQDRL